MLASPAAAQDNAAASAPPPAAADNIGPRELSNFSLNGTVTRRAAEQQPIAQPPQQAAPRKPAATGPAPAVESRSAPARTAGARPSRTEQRAAVDPLTRRPTLAAPATGKVSASSPPPGPAAVPTLPADTGGGFSPLPWIAGLLLLIAGGVLYFGLQRRGQRYAAAGASAFVGESPAPRPAAPPPAARRLPPAAPPPPGSTPPKPAGAVVSSLRAPSAPAGIVSAGLRPWIELELEPSQAMVTDEHAAIVFDVTLFNSGSAPARDIAVEACMINAGEQQDAQLTRFYATPGQVPDKIPAVAPLARVTLKSAVRLPRAAVQEYEVEGRKMFIPMVAVNSRYRWSSGEGQSAASFMVGRAADERAKLGPLRLDQGARGWKGLAARRYEKGIRV
jgi:hypothetical protein